MPLVGRTKAPALQCAGRPWMPNTALIVAHAVTLDAGDNRQLEPMAQAAKAVLETDSSPCRSRYAAGVLQRRAGRGAMRSPPGCCRVCADDAGGQQSGRWHVLRAGAVLLPAKLRHLSMPEWKDFATQQASPA